MPQVVKPQNVTVTTREGEVSIRLTIDLNLNVNGQVSATTAHEVQPSIVKTKEETEWMIPDFSASTETIEFGKYEK